MRYLVIPAYEPDEKLITLLHALPKDAAFKVILVNDGSSAKYDKIFKDAAAFATILKHPCNMGKGRALKTAFSYIQKTKEKGTIVTADADGQHTPADILHVCYVCEQHPDTFVTGIRHFTGNVPARSRLGNTLTKYIFRLATGCSLLDTQCGLRAFSTSMLPFLCQVKGERYEYEMNVLLEGAKRFPIEKVPIATVYIEGNSSSHFHPVRDGLRIYKEIFKFALSSILSFFADYAGYVLLLLLFSGIPESTRLILANVIARIGSGTLNYSLNKKFVFEDEQSVAKTGGKYIILACGILLLNTGILLLLHKIGLHNLYILKIMTELLLFLLSWMIQKHVIFHEENKNIITIHKNRGAI